jgi:hypothetical protein
VAPSGGAEATAAEDDEVERRLLTLPSSMRRSSGRGGYGSAMESGEGPRTAGGGGRSEPRRATAGARSHDGGGHLQQPRLAAGARSHGGGRRRGNPGEVAGEGAREDAGEMHCEMHRAILLRECEKKKKKKEMKIYCYNDR